MAKSRSAARASPDCRRRQAARCRLRTVSGPRSGGAAGNTKAPNRGALAGAGRLTAFFAQPATTSSRTRAMERSAFLRAGTSVWPLESGEEPFRELGFDGDAGLRRDVPQNPAEAIEVGDLLAIPCVVRIELERDGHGVEREPRLHGGDHFVAPVAGERGDAQAARIDRGQARPLPVAESIAL